MRLPRDLSGSEVARLLARHYGYRVARTRGSHMTLTLTTGTDSHSVTVPRHRDVRAGTLDAITGDVAMFLGLSKRDVRETLFG
ncbi:MAG: type II toxin-antitoxin system HicA family toxin [Alphaproteobacteria bacterium]|nr:type II toxin-antitoxin system HicA family toxin [Alphaproteobacteria bacterium]